MGYRVIYLDGREIEGKGKLPEIECEVCKEIRRNVIEPVAIFVEEERVEEIENKLIKLQEEFGNQEERLKKEVKELVKEIHKEQDGKTCIFHCEKENEIWIENVEEYRECMSRRKRILKGSRELDEGIKIKWKRNLIDEFLENLRKYMSEVEDDKEKKEYNFHYFIFPFFKEEEKEFHKVVSFRKAKFIGFLDLGSVLFMNNCYFIGTEFNQNVLFEEVIFKGKARFSGTKFYGDAGFQETEFKNVKFEGVSFKGLTFFIGISLKEIAVFDNVEFVSKVYFLDTKLDNLNTKFIREVRFSGVTFHKFTEISSLGERLKFEGVKFKDNVRIYLHEQCKELYFSNLDIEENSRVTIKGGYFTVLSHLMMEDVFNLSKNFVLFGIKLSGLGLEIRNSILENICFINCDFSEARKLMIVDSSLADIEFVNVDWGKISEEKICSELFENSPEKARETYRQLKLALDNQKNHINANKFYALEMRAYEKQLKEEGWTKDNWQDRIVFIFHKFISNFGMSYLRPFAGILILTAILGFLSVFKKFPTNEIAGLSLFSLFLMPALMVFILLYKVNSKEDKREIKNNIRKDDFNLIENVVITLLFAFSVGSFVGLWAKELSFLKALDVFAQTLNLTKAFKGNGNNHFHGYQFLYTFYSILIATLIYQFILAVRRRVKR